MRSARWVISLFLLAPIGHNIPVVAISQINAEQKINVERATEQEAREVNEVAKAFMRRIRETRDVATLKDLYLDDFMRRQIERERASLPAGQPLFLIPSVPISIEVDLLTQVSRRDWESFYAARLNFRYFFVLSIASKFKSEELEKRTDLSMRELFPAEVFRLLQTNPFLTGEYGIETPVPKKYTIETLEEMRGLITTLEQATAVLRERFLKNPPEQTRTYQENLLKQSKERKEDNERMMWPDVYGTDESRLGFPKGTRYFHLITSDSLFELWLVQTGVGMKIVWARVYPFN